MNNMEYGKILGNYMLERVLDNISPKIALKRKSKYGYIKRISPEIRHKEIDITSYLTHGKYNELILRFQSILEKYLSHCNNNGFYKRIRDLTIREFKTLEEAKEVLEKVPDATANYDEQENNISVFEFNNPPVDNYPEELKKEDISTHELIHMTTTYKKGIITLCGFHQIINKKHLIGVGLNEGYTELINERYFSHIEPTISYPNQKLIALGIEEIVGKERMEKLFFDANLGELVEELTKYIPHEEVISLLHEIDDCHINEQKDLAIHYKKAIEIRQKIARIQKIRNKALLEGQQITQEEYEYNELKSKFYSSGYILDKFSIGYSFRYNNRHERIVISKEEYRILKNTMQYGSEKEDIVTCAYKLNRVKSDLDLSAIERIELTNDNELGYNVIPRENSSDMVQELTHMLQDSTTDKQTNSTKK